MVFAAVGFFALAVALAGLAWVRIYDDQLVRQTEGELLAQGVVVAETFRRELSASAPKDYGLPRLAPWPQPIPVDGELLPLLPSLKSSSPVLPSAAEPRASDTPVDEHARRAGSSLGPVLDRVSRSTLAGIRILDVQGIAVASSSGALGTTHLDREEVQRALRGEPTSVIRERKSDHTDADLASLSRNTGYRVSVALPVLHQDRVVGVVLLSRTPLTLAKVFYADRWNLTSAGLVLVFVIALVSLLAATLVLRPLRRLVGQARAIAEGDAGGHVPIGKPVVEELAVLSEALAGMATALHERNEYIRSFAASVSHEFKTPLAAILGAVELLRDDQGGMPAEQRARFLTNVDADAQRLNALVKRLLELARADAMAPSVASAPLAATLAKLEQRGPAELDLQVVGGSGGAETQVALPAEVLETVLWQLCTNAKQHGATRVELFTRTVAGGASIEVRDDGPGISEANRARIFDAFFTTRRDSGGTGLGLTIARSLLRPFGGKLELGPPSPHGASFVVTMSAQRK